MNGSRPLVSGPYCLSLGVCRRICAAPRCEHHKARGRSQPERTRLYVRIGDDRERREATHIGAALVCLIKSKDPDHRQRSVVAGEDQHCRTGVYRFY